MLLVIAFVLFALMLVSWFVAPGTERVSRAGSNPAPVDAMGAALQQ
jgi:hypothetical protein